MDTVGGCRHVVPCLENDMLEGLVSVSGAFTAATQCVGGPHRGRRELKLPVLHVEQRHSHLWGARNPQFLGHRLRTSMTRATVEDSTAGLGQTVGGFSFHGVSGLCTHSLAHRGARREAQDMRRRPMQAWVSTLLGRSTACDPHALVGDQCGEQRGPDLMHKTTTPSSSRLVLRRITLPKKETSKTSGQKTGKVGGRRIEMQTGTAGVLKNRGNLSL